ncbi:MAG: hypothetical protein ACSHWS_08395 [Sulfitobacter sp.]
MQLKIAAALAVLTGCVHLFVGTIDTLYPALSNAAPLAAQGPVIATWYILGLVFIWSGWVFWQRANVTQTLGVLWCAGAVIFVIIALVEAGLAGLMVLPQWVLLGATGMLAVAGAPKA